MSRLLLVVSCALLCLGLFAPQALAQDSGAEDLSEAETVVDILPIEGFIDPPVAAAIRDVIVQAAERDSELVVLQLNSPGSVSADMDELLDTIQNSPVPVAVFIGPRGADAEGGGAAGLVFLAADVRAIAEGATLGPLAPADLGNRSDDPDDPSALLAATLVDDLDVLETLMGASLEAERAEELGLADLVVNGLEPLLVELDGRTVVTAAGEDTLRIRRDEVGVRFHSLGLVRRLLHAATTPVFIYLLFTVGLAMLLFEVFQPGFGVAGMAGVITAAIGVFGLIVLPVNWWALALIVLGLVLYAVDTAVAGLGPITAAATAAFGAGSWWLYDSPVLELPLWMVIGTTIAALGFFVIILTTVLRAQAPPDEATVEDLVGRVGVVRSVLNPEGHVYIDEALWRARWTGEGRRAKVGTPVRVHGVDGPLLLVEAFDPERAREAARSS